MNTFVQHLNTDLVFKRLENVRNLAVGEKLKIVRFEKINTQYGDKIAVEFDEFKTILPQRYTQEFTVERIKEINGLILSGKNFYLTNLGPVGRTTNIMFNGD